MRNVGWLWKLGPSDPCVPGTKQVHTHKKRPISASYTNCNQTIRQMLTEKNKTQIHIFTVVLTISKNVGTAVSHQGQLNYG